MSNDLSREPMLEIFVFETLQLVEQLEQEVLHSEQQNGFSSAAINQIFRIMHTIKSSAAMMLFKNISSLAHSTEDLFFFIREQKPEITDQSKLTDIILEGIDYIKNEMTKIQNGKGSDTDAAALISKVKSTLEELKAQYPVSSPTVKEQNKDTSPQKYYIAPCKSAAANMKNFKSVIFFEDGCEMENVRAFTVIHHLKELAEEIHHTPEDIIANESTAELIQKKGITIYFTSERSQEELQCFFRQTSFLKHFELEEIQAGSPLRKSGKRQIILDDLPNVPVQDAEQKDMQNGNTHQSIISVNVSKLDKLMDTVGELVIAEAMVTQNPELTGLKLDGFYKAARQLRKITGELQDIVMSVRMVPLAPTFQKMHRVARDAGKFLQKNITLEISGEETEVDKNIIEHISDPLMHLIRNAIDHGIEPAAERTALGKPEKGRIILEAKNAGGDVWIIVKDDGKGLNKEKILKIARENGLTNKPESELSDKEIYSFIFLPGFSTKDQVTEMSGRGVGMDVVTKNIEKVGGSIQIESQPGEGTTISIKIPLTLAIIDGMTIKVGNSRYTIPITSIRESFRIKEENVIIDPDGNEMALIRGECYPILRLHEIYGLKTDVTSLYSGITVMVESKSRGFCFFADALLGQQQVVVKALPSYIKKVRGLAGCTLLGDGNISLILDVDSFINSFF